MYLQKKGGHKPTTFRFLPYRFHFLIFTLEDCPFFFRRFLYSPNFFFGTLTVVAFVIPLNVLLESVFAFSFVDFIVIVFNFLHPEKTFSPIFDTFLPIVTVFSFLLFLNAFAAMPVTLYFFPCTRICTGIFTSVSFFLLPANDTVPPFLLTL